MTKFTAEQIKEILKCHTKRKCYDCPLGKEDIQQLNKPCSTMIAEMALDLINKYESIKEEMQETIDSLRAANIALYGAVDDNKKLEEEINKLKLEMSYMHNPNTIGDRHEMGCW